MKWRKKYTVDMELARKLNHEEGLIIQDISERLEIPRTTLLRYFHKSNIPVYVSSHNGLKTRKVKRSRKRTFVCAGAWKRALVERFGHKCSICGYETIVEAHHILPMVDGGITSLKNGILLCPNHHAEAHAEIIDLIALSKSGELLGKQEIVNQQPSRKSSKRWIRKPLARVAEGSETRLEAKAIISPRAPERLTP